MEEGAKIDRLISHTKEYGEERLKLIILNLKEKVSGVLSNALSALVLFVLVILTVLFVSIALAWWIGLELQQPLLGFLVVGGIYLLASILVYVKREKWIKTPVVNGFLKSVADED